MPGRGTSEPLNCLTTNWEPQHGEWVPLLKATLNKPETHLCSKSHSSLHPWTHQITNSPQSNISNYPSPSQDDECWNTFTPSDDSCSSTLLSPQLMRDLPHPPASWWNSWRARKPHRTLCGAIRLAEIRSLCQMHPPPTGRQSRGWGACPKWPPIPARRAASLASHFITMGKEKPNFCHFSPHLVPKSTPSSSPLYCPV